MSRILFLAPRFHTNQSELVATLIERGHQVRYMVMGQSKSEDHSRLQPSVMPISRLDRLAAWFRDAKRDDYFYCTRRTIPSLRAMSREIFGFKPDVAVIRPFYSYFTCFAVLLFMLRGTRIVLYTQTPKYKQEVRWRDKRNVFLITKLLRWKLFTVVERIEGGEDYKEISPAKHFIPFAHSLDVRALERTYDTSLPRLLVIGKFESRKNYTALLKGLALIQFPYQLTIIGQSTTRAHSLEYSRVEQLIREYGLQDYVTLFQNQLHDFVKDQYLRHDVFVLPSYDEPASVSQLEAMAAGMAVIICRENGTANYVEHGRNGLLCERDAKSLAKSLNDLLANSQQIEAFGRASIEVLQEKCCPQTVCAQLEQLITTN